MSNVRVSRHLSAVLDDFCHSALPEQHSPAPRQIFSLHQVFAVLPTDGLEPEPTNECGRHYPDPSVHESSIFKYQENVYIFLISLYQM